VQMVAAMKQGSVIVDLAAEAGGNCEATKPGELHNHRGVTVIGVLCTAARFSSCLDERFLGYTDLPSRLPTQSSTLYSNNITKFLLSITPPNTPGRFALDLEDEVVRGALVVHQGNLMAPVPRAPVVASVPPATSSKKDEKKETLSITPWQKATREVATLTAAMGTVVALGKFTGPLFMSNVGFPCLPVGHVAYATTRSLHLDLLGSSATGWSGASHPRFTRRSCPLRTPFPVSFYISTHTTHVSDLVPQAWLVLAASSLWVVVTSPAQLPRPSERFRCSWRVLMWLAVS
jgi:hypothetical protein